MRTLEGVRDFLLNLQEDFDALGDKTLILEALMDLGAELGTYPEGLKTPEYKVSGCVSEVYVAAQLGSDGRIVFLGTSSSAIVAGVVSVFVQALSGLTPEDTLKAREHLERFALESGIAKSAVATRANAVGSIIEKMDSLCKTLAKGL